MTSPVSPAGGGALPPARRDFVGALRYALDVSRPSTSPRIAPSRTLSMSAGSTYAARISDARPRTRAGRSKPPAAAATADAPEQAADGGEDDERRRDQEEPAAATPEDIADSFRYLEKLCYPTRMRGRPRHAISARRRAGSGWRSPTRARRSRGRGGRSRRLRRRDGRRRATSPRLLGDVARGRDGPDAPATIASIRRRRPAAPIVGAATRTSRHPARGFARALGRARPDSPCISRTNG